MTLFKSRVLFCFILLTAFLQELNAQNIVTLSGKVADSATGKTIPGANVFISRTGRGTSTNREGVFTLRLVDPARADSVEVSCIGYRSYFAAWRELADGNKTIKLVQEDVAIGAVIVLTDDALRRLLKNAYERIELNYHIKPTLLRGFYREVMQIPDSGVMVSFSEGVIETAKSSYKNSDDDGQVRLIESVVKEFPALKGVAARYYGGAFSATTSDFVKQRDGIIRPSSYNKFYRYRLVDMTRYRGRDVYVVGFDTQLDELKGGSRGKLYIDKESMAYIAIEAEATPYGLKHYNPNATTRSLLKTKINYQMAPDGRWYFHSKQSSVVDEHLGKKIEMTGSYITTNITTDSVRPIPLDEQFAYRDIFLNKAKEKVSDDYWKNYNVLKRDSVMESQLSPRFDTLRSRELAELAGIAESEKKTGLTFSAVIGLVTRISSRLGVSYVPLTSPFGVYGFSYGSISSSRNVMPMKFIPAFSYQLDYNINNRWSLNWLTLKSLDSKYMLRSNDFGITYNMRLSRWSRPVIGELSAAYSIVNAGVFYDTYNSDHNFNLGGKHIDASRLKFATGLRSQGITPRIGVRYNFSKAWWIYGAVSYHHSLNLDHRLFVEEQESNIFKRDKRASISLSDPRVQFTNFDNPTLNSNLNLHPWSFTLGLIFRL